VSNHLFHFFDASALDPIVNDCLTSFFNRGSVQNRGHHEPQGGNAVFS
jgi:hypothetical protein